VAAFFASGSTTAQAKPPVTLPQAQPLANDTLKNSPASTVVENKAVKQSIEQPPAALEEFAILSSVEKEVNVDRIVVTGIPNTDCGRVVGRNGSNVKRIEEEYSVRLSFNNGNLFITEGNAESRLAASTDVIENLPVTIECPNLDLRNNIFSSNYLLKELAFNHNVRIYRPSLENNYVTIWGTIERCRTVYKILQNGSR
jgi:hypothetical protein